jgi:hypothetical protein
MDFVLPEIHLGPQSPSRAQAFAARVFHPNRHAIATAVFDFNDSLELEAQAPMVFHFSNNANLQALTPVVFDPDRGDLAPMFFHSGDLVSGRALTSHRFFHELRSA